MKCVSYILAFYLILLSVIPCCAFDNCPDDKPEHKIAEQKTNHQENEYCGNCSPFFSCEGCATATIAFSPLNFQVPFIQQRSVYAMYIQSLLPHIDYDVWQPPRLG